MIIGIDPGQSGGLATLDETLWMEPMPVCDEGGVDAKELARLIHACRGAKAAYLEKVHAMPKQGVSSTFTFGKNVGITIGVLASFGIPIIEVRPQEWQKRIYENCPHRLEGKDRSKWAFERLFPGIDARAPRGRTPHLGMIEAALIADYGRRVGAC